MSSGAWSTKNEQAIGAWVMKANPDVFDALSALADYGELTSWSVRDSYRLGMFQPGQPVLLWITAGGNKEVEAGFYAAGEITDSRIFTADGAGAYWSSKGEAQHHDLYVQLRLRELETPILRSDILSISELAAIEPIHAPQLPNPGVLLLPEYRVLADRYSLETI